MICQAVDSRILAFCFRRRHSVHDVTERMVFPCFVALAMFDHLQRIEDI